MTGLGWLVALAWWTGAVGRGRVKAPRQRRKHKASLGRRACQDRPPYPGEPGPKLNTTPHPLYAPKGVTVEGTHLGDSFIWQIPSTH